MYLSFLLAIDTKILQKKKAENTSRFLLRSLIMTLLTRANEIHHQLSDEHHTFLANQYEN
jgi:hypothetical protein